MAKIGFVGLGNMGTPMVINLLKAGHEVIVYDINPEAITNLVKKGAIPADIAGDVAVRADIVFTMLQTAEQVQSVCLGEEGIFENLPEEAIYIDSSSVDITSCRLLHQIAAEKNISMLDTPVSGGTVGAANATLTFMVGGDEKILKKVRPILEQIGKRIVHTGPAGTGQAAKICNNMLLGISMIGVSEAFTLGKNLGLSPEKLFEVASNSSGSCWSLLVNCPVPNLVETSPANKDYKPGFTSHMMHKDLHNSQNAAKDSNTNTPLGALATKLYEAFNDIEHNKKLDFSAIIKMLENENK